MFSLLSLNSRGLDARKENLIFEYISSSAVDICCVQETMIVDSDKYVSLASRWRGSCFWSPSVGRGAGSLILISDVF